MEMAAPPTCYEIIDLLDLSSLSIERVGGVVHVQGFVICPADHARAVKPGVG